MLQTKVDITTALKQVQQEVAQIASGLSEEAFFHTPDNAWSSADYLKHLILSVKPFARGLALPKDKLKELFGTPDHPSMTYDELVTMYEAKLATGFGAEDANSTILPVDYRFPEGVDDIRAYLIETWNIANDRLLSALENWDDAMLDQYQLPHPAVGPITLREMLFFTVHHNSCHRDDIKAAEVV